MTLGSFKPQGQQVIGSDDLTSKSWHDFSVDTEVCKDDNGVILNGHHPGNSFDGSDN